jgi:hypothetical protein
MATIFAINRLAVLTTFVVVNLLIQVACRTVPPTNDVKSTAPPPSASSIPLSVNRLAIWYPPTSEKEEAYGYRRLAQAVFEGKKHRPWLKILERRDLNVLQGEVGLQLAGRVADETAISIGRWLGADSVALFQIESPSWRDRMYARIYETMPPIMVMSKVLSVESGEILYQDMVTSRPHPPSGRWDDYRTDADVQVGLKSALDQALSAAVEHLEQSFQEHLRR